VNYLFQQYGKGRSPSTGLLERYWISENTNTVKNFIFCMITAWRFEMKLLIAVRFNVFLFYFMIIKYRLFNVYNLNFITPAMQHIFHRMDANNSQSR
jgi:hypothetical protein